VPPHAGGISSAVDLLQRGRSEWQLSAESKPLIWQSGIDAQFIGIVVTFLAVTALTVGAYISLARAMRAARSAQTQQVSD
jgi:hypothetical protein